MNRFMIWESPFFRISHSYRYSLPGYLFVETLEDANHLDQPSLGAIRKLGEALALAEHLVMHLTAAERVYVLKFGESDERIHFHVIPRTPELLEAYLSSATDKAPYNGARITAWLWENCAVLKHSAEEIDAFVAAARAECLEWKINRSE